jgi:hypothetical protein
MGMHLGCRERLKNFHRVARSPRWQVLVFVADEEDLAEVPLPIASILGRDSPENNFIITPRALARPAFMPMGKLSAQTLPVSMSHVNEGRGFPYR